MSSHTNQHYSLLRDLRSLAPARPLYFSELRPIVERQAAHVCEYLGRENDQLDLSNLHRLPRVSIRISSGLPVSGLTHWSGAEWVILVSADEPQARRRFTLMHELFHVIHHGRSDPLSSAQEERLADYFAGCALMPRPLLKQLWCGGLQRLDLLASRLGVSRRAAEVRLMQIGLIDQPAGPARQESTEVAA